MSVLMIRAHKRFAVCRKARLRKPGRRGADGLLIELSLDGCRISNVEQQGFELDQLVTVRVEGAQPFDGRIRWQRDGTLGLRFVKPLRIAALDQLIRLCRGELSAAEPMRSYGT